MKKILFIPILVMLLVFLSTGIAAAATTRDITVKKLGGKVGDIFKISGSLIVKSLTVTGKTTLQGDTRIDGKIYRGAKAGANIGDNKPVYINDDMFIRGNLSVSGNTGFTKNKIYSGTIDLTQTGDEVVTTADGACAVPTLPKHSAYHYKIISVPELNMDTSSGIRVYTKTPTTGGIVAPPWTPQSGEVWGGAGYTYYNTGVVYLGYKVVTTLCNDTATTTNYITGPYRISIIY